MILWHLGIAALLVYATLGRARIDYRYVFAGAVLPDLLDGVALTAGAEWASGRGAAHSLAFALVVAVAVVALFRGERRLAVFGLFVGLLTHLVADGMWNEPRIFLWPAFGTAFVGGGSEPYSWDLLLRPWDHPWTWAGEAAGLLILWWFAVAFHLGDPQRRRRWLHDGRLRA